MSFSETTPEEQELDISLLPLATLSTPAPVLVDTEAVFVDCIEALDHTTGDIAVDAERAGGFRYSHRAYLLQLRAESGPTWLVDPLAVDATRLAPVLNQRRWILHAANQDLPCLNELGLHPAELMDTELAGRILHEPRVGLATLIGKYLSVQLKKEHSAADWSQRPLPDSWLEYAAFDVEYLHELAAILNQQLGEQDRLGWAEAEFSHVRNLPAPTPKTDPWRRIKGLQAKTPRQLALARELWQARDEIASRQDLAPGKVLPDRVIASFISRPPHSVADLQANTYVRNAHMKNAQVWLTAVARAEQLSDQQLPPRRVPRSGVPDPRNWARIDPVADQALQRAKTTLTNLAEVHHVPREILLAPQALRETVWNLCQRMTPSEITERDVRVELTLSGARAWQVGLVVPALTTSLTNATSAEVIVQAPATPAAEAVTAAAPTEPADTIDAN